MAKKGKKMKNPRKKIIRPRTIKPNKEALVRKFTDGLQNATTLKDFVWNLEQLDEMMRPPEAKDLIEFPFVKNRLANPTGPATMLDVRLEACQTWLKYEAEPFVYVPTAEDIEAARELDAEIEEYKRQKRISKPPYQIKAKEEYRKRELPWESSSATPSSIYTWSVAGKIREAHMDYPDLKSKALSRIVLEQVDGEISVNTIESILSLIKQHDWNPIEDEEWLKRFGDE